jgi:hypothetical protein
VETSPAYFTLTRESLEEDCEGGGDEESVSCAFLLRERFLC